MYYIKILLIFLLLINCNRLFAGSVNKEKNQYILYACPEGELQKDLLEFWEICKNSQTLKNRAVEKYPPHVTLIDFFDKKLKNSDYIKILKDIVNEVSIKNDIKIHKSEIFRNKEIHAIYFKSKYLRKISEIFVQKCGIPYSKLKSKRSKPEYHLTLAHRFNQKANFSLIEHEKKINLKKTVKFNLCLYELEYKNNKSQLKLIHSEPLS